MTFTTLTFLIFFAVVFALYWSLRHRTAQNVLLVIASYFFYGWWDWRFCWLMLASSLLDYFVGLGLDSAQRPAARRALLITALVGNLGLLGFFKYFNFFTDNLQASAAALGWKLDLPTLRVVLPIGISFYTFQTMSYSIDIYRRQLRATRNLIEYMAYVSFFPQLVAGPIERGTHLLPQFACVRDFDYARAADGCRQMLWGFLKKMVIADNLAPLVDRAFGDVTSHSGPQLFIATVFFAVQIYCDFSGYSDIACGTARLFGIELMRNFNMPYFSQSLREFWKRWHISLSTWFRDYVYLPLGGGRVSRARCAFNVMTTFLLSGLWHGASWNFLVWGALHGAAVLPQILLPRRNSAAVTRPWLRAPKILGVFSFVCIGWIFFRAENLSDAVTVLRKAAPAPFALENWFSMFYFTDKSPMGAKVLIPIGVLFFAEWFQRRRPHPLQIPHCPWPLRWTLYFGATAVLLIFGTYNTSTFIYFQF